MPEMRRVVTKKIGELLVERGVINEGQLKEALKLQIGTKKLLGEILIELGYATEEEITGCLTTQYGVPYLSLDNYEIDPEIIKSVPAELAKTHNFIPIDRIDNLLTIVTSDIMDSAVFKDIEKDIGCKIQSFITTPTALKKVIEKYYK